MDNAKDIVITGLGIVSPIGSGLETYWDTLLSGQSGVGVSSHYTLDDVQHIARLPYPMVAEVKNLETKRIKPRKNIKVMARDIQLGFVAADYAREDGQLEAKPVDPDRQGIVYGALMVIVDVGELGELYMGAVDENGVYHPSWFGNTMDKMYPLWMLKYLPNMTACHIGIAFDLRGPSNTVVCGETGGVAAMLEACRVLKRGYTDLMYAGGCACCTTPSAWTRYDLCQVSTQFNDPQAALRPFDTKRDGVVFGEGAGCSVIETRESAERRGVPIYAKILGGAETAEHVWNQAMDFAAQPEEVKIDRTKFTGDSIRNAVRLAVERSGLKPEDFAFVMASGNATILGDAAEARAIRDVMGDVPVTAIKGAMGYAMSGSSAIEIATSTLALTKGVIPAVRNCENVSADCPINVVTGSPREIPADKKAAIIISYNFYGQAAVLVIAKD